MGERTGRARLVLVLVGVLLIAAVAMAVRAHRSGSGAGRSTATSGRPATQSTRQAELALGRMARAVLAHDRAAYLTTVEPSVRTAQGRVFDNERAVPFREYRYTVRSVDPADARTRRVTAHVDLAYRLSADPRPVHRSLDVTFAGTGPHPWRVRSVERTGGSPPDPWDLGPVSVVTGSRAVVLGTGSKQDLASYARLASAAARRIDVVWGTGWPRRTVVVVPRNQAQLERLLGTDSHAGLGRVAAVTTGDSVTGATAGEAQRIIVNPEAMAKLSDLGHRVTLTHEMTHVATRYTSTAAPPLWLAEGFADQVAYTGSGLSDRAIAQGALTRRQAAALTALPADSRFDPKTTDLAPAYVQAWSAADEIAHRYGRARLVALYRAVAAPPAPLRSRSATSRTADAFPDVLGVSVNAFIPLWRERLERAAS